MITQKIDHDAILAFSTLGAGSLDPRAVSVKMPITIDDGTFQMTDNATVMFFLNVSK